MWLFTSFGFFSAVQKSGDSILTIRSRVADDLNQLRERYLPDLSPTQFGGGTDYPYRATATKIAYALALSDIARDLDYSNFKDTVAEKQGMDRAKTYSKVWGALLDLDKSKPPHKSLHSSKRRSYGGVVINGSGEVLLIEPKDHFDGYMWTFPKGHAKEGETPFQAAIREVIEETGQIVGVGIPVPGTFEGGTTLNQYFLMEPPPQSKEQRTCEVSSIKWASYSDARALILKTTNTIGRKRDLAVLEAGFMTWHQANINRINEVSHIDPTKLNTAELCSMNALTNNTDNVPPADGSILANNECSSSLDKWIIEDGNMNLVGSIVETLEKCTGKCFVPGKKSSRQQYRSVDDDVSVLVLTSKNYGENKFLYDLHESQIKFLKLRPDSIVCFGFKGKDNFFALPLTTVINKLPTFPVRMYEKTGEMVWRIQIQPPEGYRDDSNTMPRVVLPFLEEETFFTIGYLLFIETLGEAWKKWSDDAVVKPFNARGAYLHGKTNN